LPKEILQTNDLNTDFIKTDFENIRVNPEMPKENTWYYPSYQNEYHLAKKQNDLPVLSAGSIAPEWKLKLLNEDKTLSSNDLKGKVILLDFWIKNCNGCIESIPYLKNIQEKYKNDDFVLISINSYDSVEKLNWFSEKYQLNYPVLINGKSVADKYGVYAFPTIFVIDKTGKIIYNDGAGADEDKIEAILKKALGK
jgi:peroxiredoxin